jgi:hypothetical protein
VTLEPSTKCGRPELLLLDTFSDKKIVYLGNESILSLVETFTQKAATFLVG